MARRCGYREVAACIDRYAHPLKIVPSQTIVDYLRGKPMPLRRFVNAPATAHVRVVGSMDGLDFCEFDLSGVDFSGSSLVGAKLNKCEMDECRFFDVDMTKISARRASWRHRGVVRVR